MSDAPRVGRRPVRKQLNRGSWRATRRAILERDGWTCRDGGRSADRVDHMTPPDRHVGPHDDPANLVACCAGGKNSKRAMTVAEWHASTGKTSSVRGSRSDDAR